ncbi:hypothetical protein O0L34_g3263 [Tuta absoluta]|nr:hypothetical protein O0L34_g3263 [Tuta absoluta]
MHARPAAGARAARLLGLLVLAVALTSSSANAGQYSASNDLKHHVMKRSPNDSVNDKYKLGPDNDDFLEEQVSATEDSVSASGDEKIDELKNTSDSSEVSSAKRDLEAALAVQPAADNEQRSARPDNPTTPFPINEPSLSRRSARPDDTITTTTVPIAEPTLTNTDDLENSSLDHGSNSTGTPAYSILAESSKNSSRRQSDQQRPVESDSIYETGYKPTDKNDKNWDNLKNPHALQPIVNLKDQPLRFFGDQPASLQNNGLYNHNSDEEVNPTLNQNNPYYTQSMNADPAWSMQSPTIGNSPYIGAAGLDIQARSETRKSINADPAWSMQAPVIGNSPYIDAAGLDPQALFQTQLNPYVSLANAKAIAAQTIQNRLSSSPRTLIPRSELLYLERIPGGDNLISCGQEGEMYNLQAPWSDECFVCACVVERGRVQPACASCAPRCARSAPGAPLTPPPPDLLAPFDNEKIPTFLPQLPILEPQPQVENVLTGPAAACAPLPFAEPFQQPLNPCRICMCQKRNNLSNEVYVTCTEDPQCVKQPLQEPILPNTTVATALCDKFPAHVQFPHPTQSCQVCTCVRRPPATFAFIANPTLAGKSDMHLQCTQDYKCQDGSRITTPKAYFSEQGPDKPFEPYINPNNPNINPIRPAVLPKIILPSNFGLDIDLVASALADESNEVTSTPKPLINQLPQYPQIPQLPQRPGSLPLHVNPSVYPTPQQPTDLRPLQPQAIPWPPKTIPALPKQEQGPLLGPPPHRSCAPYPANTPFEHPWDSCQQCVCADYSAPGQHSVEVNCYTKPSCCIEPPVHSPPSSALLPGSGLQALPSSSSLLLESVSPKPLQILDSMCELKSLGAEFVNERDSCQVCSCVPLGRVVVPQCRSNGDPLSPTSPSLISYVEPKCRHHSPDQPFVSGCSVCVCHIVFTLVVVKCTPQPKCLQQMEQNSRIINLTKNGLLYTPRTNQPYTNPIFGIQFQNLPLYRYNSAYMNALQQFPRNNFKSYAQKALDQTLGYRPKLQFGEAQQLSSLLQMYKNNAQKYGGYPQVATDANSLAFLDQWKSLQSQSTSQANALGTAQHFSVDSSEDLIDAINNANMQTSYPSFNGYDPQIREQNLLRQQKVEAKAQAGITTNENINPQQKTQIQLDTSLVDSAMDWNQLKAGASAGADKEISTYSTLSNSYSYSPPQMTYYPIPITESNTPSYAESRKAESNAKGSSASGLLSALSNAGAGGELVTRTGRGECAYAGDTYHHACQACFCLADDTSGGELYSMCLGKPCH